MKSSHVNLEKQHKLYELCHDYLCDNFHKFSEKNKIAVAKAICTRYIPQTVQGEVKHIKMEQVKYKGKPVEAIIGNRVAEDALDAPEDFTNRNGHQ